MALCQGSSLYLILQREMLAGEVLVEIIKEKSITHATLPPIVLASISEHTELEAVDMLIIAGDVLDGALAEAMGAKLPFDQCVRADGSDGMVDCI